MMSVSSPALFELGSGVLFPEGVGAGDGVALGSSLEEETLAADSFTREGVVESAMVERKRKFGMQVLVRLEASPLDSCWAGEIRRWLRTRNRCGRTCIQ